MSGRTKDQRRVEREREARRAARRAAAARRGPLRNAGWYVGVGLGVVAGTAAALGVQGWQAGREAADVERRAAEFARVDPPPEPVDAIRELLAQDSRVVVDPLLADRVDEADLARAEAILDDDAATPARIAYLSYPEGLYEGYTSSGALEQWAQGVGEVGHYVVVWDRGGYASTAVGLEPSYLDARTQGQPGPALVRVAAEVAAWEAVPAATEPDRPSDFDYWGGLGGGIGAGALIGLLTVLPVFLVLRWWVGTRRRREA